MFNKLKETSRVLGIEVLHQKRVLLGITIGISCLIIYLSTLNKDPDIQLPPVSIDIPEPSPIAIAGFYHFSTVASRWKGIVAEQMLLAHLSGLINATYNIYVTGLGKFENNQTIFDIFSGPKFIYEYDTKIEVYEYPTLIKLEKFCYENNQSLVWYAHSKGASHENNHQGAWRDVMNYFVLDKWHHCHGLLSTTNYTTCGAILVYDSLRPAGSNTYYAGNMWWAKCSHVNRLTRVEKLDQKNRHLPELYITSEPTVGHFNCLCTNSLVHIPLTRENASCTINYPPYKIQ